MFDTVDKELASWVTEVLPDAAVVFELPSAPAVQAHVGLHLLELGERPPARGHGRAPLQIALRYLVTTWAADPIAAHRCLGMLLFAAMEHPGYEVRFPDNAHQFWHAAGLAPRAGFLLSVPVRLERPEPHPQPVLAPLKLELVGTRSLIGVVLGPGDIPVADAVVEIPPLALSTRSDRNGHFRFAAVPGVGWQHRLRVRAKAREFLFEIDGSADEPVQLHLDLVS